MREREGLMSTKTRPTCGCWKKVVETLNKHPGADIRRWKQFEDTECFNCGQKAEEVE